MQTLQAEKVFLVKHNQIWSVFVPKHIMSRNTIVSVHLVYLKKFSIVLTGLEVIKNYFLVIVNISQIHQASQLHFKAMQHNLCIDTLQQMIIWLMYNIKVKACFSLNACVVAVYLIWLTISYG